LGRFFFALTVAVTVPGRGRCPWPLISPLTAAAAADLTAHRSPLPLTAAADQVNIDADISTSGRIF